MGCSGKEEKGYAGEAAGFEAGRLDVGSVSAKCGEPKSRSLKLEQNATQNQGPERAVPR